MSTGIRHTNVYTIDNGCSYKGTKKLGNPVWNHLRREGGKGKEGRRERGRMEREERGEGERGEGRRRERGRGERGVGKGRGRSEDICKATQFMYNVTWIMNILQVYNCNPNSLL